MERWREREHHRLSCAKFWQTSLNQNLRSSVPPPVIQFVGKSSHDLPVTISLALVQSGNQVGLRNPRKKEQQILSNNFQFLNPLPTCKYIHFKRTFTCPRSIMIAGVSWSQALLGYLITAHHLCAFLMYLACYLCGGKTKTKQKKRLYTLACVPDVIGRLTVSSWCPHNKTKNKESYTLYAFSYPDRRIERVGGVATFPNKTKQYLSKCAKHDV